MHTPGPWQVIYDPMDFAPREIVQEADPLRVIAFVTHNGHEPHNAALMAAAPELLLVAKRCLAMVEDGAGPPDWDWIRRVIRKATTP